MRGKRKIISNGVNKYGKKAGERARRSKTLLHYTTIALPAITQLVMKPLNRRWRYVERM